MIGAMNSNYQMQGMSGVGGMRPMGPPPGPPPGGDPVEQLESAVSNGEVDTEELSAKLSEVFGEDADGIVGEDGSVDFEALSSLIAAERSDKMTADLTEKFGEDAAQFVTDTGEVDHEGLRAFLDENGFAPPEKPQGPPPGGMFGGGLPTGYGAAGQATTGPDAMSFLNILA